MSLMVAPAELARRREAEDADYYLVGQAHGMLIKSAAKPVAAPVLHGRLIVTPAKWGMVLVPNSLIRGVFDAINEPGVELPLRDGVLRGHISVFRPEEIDEIGGEDKISERGHPFSYQLGPLMVVEPKGWDEMSKAWFIKVISPELKALRKSYGLTPLLNGDHDFHCTVAVRRKNVMGPGPISKAAVADEDEIHAGGDLDDDDDDSPREIKIPLSIQKICITRISVVKPDGDKDDDDDGNGLEAFMDMLRDRAKTKTAADGGIQDILSEWKPPENDPFKGFEGFASSYKPQTSQEQAIHGLGQMLLAGAPPLALAGGLSLWRPWEKQRRKKPAVKTAAVSDVLNSVYSQLPRMRVPDTAVGAGLGALGGLGYDWFQGDHPGKDRWRKRLGRVLTGAGAGALAGNVVGDRARRYIANSFVPFGYESNPTQALMPKSLSHVWNAAILDKPQHEVADPAGIQKLKDFGKKPGLDPQVEKYRQDTMANYILPARHELMRRQLGVHTNNPATDIWQEGPNDQLSLNTQNPQAAATAQRFMGDVTGGIPGKLFKTPGEAEGTLKRVSKGSAPYALFDIAATGGEQIPYRKLPNGALDASVLDRWDYTLDPKEQEFFQQNAGNMLSPDWRNAAFDPKEPISQYMSKERMPGRTNAQAWNSLANRWGMDNLVAYKHPWITQRFRVEPDPNPVPPDASGMAPPAPQRIQMLTPEGAPLGDPITHESNQAFLRDPATIKKGAGGGIQDILSGWMPPPDNPYGGLEGFAGTFRPPTVSDKALETLGYGATAAAIPLALGGGLALWRPWEKAKPARRHRAAVKAAAVSDVTNAIYSQLPRVRLPDSLVGAGVGALGGLGYDWFQGAEPGENRWRKRLGRALTGAGAGALLGNVVGDRTRRYISNSFVPFGYDNNAVEALKPKSLSHVWNAAILDKPQYDVANPKGMADIRDYNKPPNQGDKVLDYDSRRDTMENYVLPARRELFRRQLGVHTNDPARDMWTEGPNDRLSLNAANPRAVAAAQRFMSSPGEPIAKDLFRSKQEGLKYLHDATVGKRPNVMFTNSVVGGQQIPYRELPGGVVDASIFDRWDYTLDPKEHDFVTQNARNMLDPAWRNAKFAPKTPLSEYLTPHYFSTNAAAWQALAGRSALDNIIAYKHPWVTQRFQLEHDPKWARSLTGQAPDTGGRRIRLLTPEGETMGAPITQMSNQGFLSHPIKEGAAKKKDPPGLVAENEKIRENRKKPENQKPHKFEAAQWTHGNGHPRCIRCGEEQSMDNMCSGYKPPPAVKRAATDEAPGLPSRADMGPLDKLRVGQMLDYVVQQHDAERAGRHYDVRFGGPDMGLLSWAARKGLPDPGARHLAVQQPVHRHEYKDFEGTIPSGYGAGKVKKYQEGQVLITKVTPESIHFTTAHPRHPERYTLARPKGWGDRNWLMMNTTPNKPVPYEKIHYKKIPPEAVEPHLQNMQAGDTAEAKVDGASQLVQLAKNQAELLSFRTSKTTGRPIFHTERVFGGRPEIPVPKHLEGSILKGEVYAHRDGKVGTPQDVGMLLNSGIARSLQLQKEKGLALRNMLYDVQQYGKKPIDPTVVPRDERRRMLEEIAQHLPQDKFHVSEEAHGPEAATKLWNLIRSGEHPLTEEGAVIHPKVGIPSKAKLTEEYDTHITGTFPGEGKRQATIGGFTYGHEPGKTVGKVGTGFSDDFLREVARDPSAYVGRIARLRSQQKLPSGALRAPSFIGLHEDKTAAEKLASFFGYGEPTLGMAEGVPDYELPGEHTKRKRPTPPPPPSWLDMIRHGLWGSPDAVVPEVIEALEGEQDGAGMIPKTGAAKSSKTDEHGKPCPPGECCPKCHARLECDPDSGKCNQCGHNWCKQAAVLDDLKRAKSESDRRNYPAKHQIISELLNKHSDEFFQDSFDKGMIGLTHRSTGFKIHAPRHVVRGRVKAADLLPWVDLQEQQKRVAERVRRGENLLVMHGLGSGKSLAGIAGAEAAGGPYSVVAPASLRANYEKELKKFTDMKDPAEVLSYTGIGMGKQPKIAPNTLIFDEAQRIRNPGPGTQAAVDLAMKAKHRVLLSGTPIVNRPSDLAIPLSILTGNEMSPAGFNQQFVGTKTVKPGWMGWFQGVKPVKVPTLQNEEDLERMLEGHVDYQPSKTPEGVTTQDERVEVDLSPEQQNFYKLMWGKLPWMLRWKLSNDYPLSKQELSHLSAFMTGPRQAALSLYPYHSSKDPLRAFQTSSKLQAAMGSLKETLAKDPRAKALVYSNFIDAGLAPYAAALEHEKIPYGQFHGTMTDEERKRTLDEYNAGKRRVLLIGPAGAEGISAKGTQLIQLMDPHWNEARLGQARGRGLRFDSHEGLPPELRDVRIQRFIAKMPPPGWLGSLFGQKPRPSADQVLEQQARRKEELNEQFRDVLRRVGSPGYRRPWHLFG